MLTHNWNNHAISQLTEATKIGKYDVPASYVNVTQMCQAHEKQFNDYARLESTKAFWDALRAETGILVSGLVITIKGGNDKKIQGTWAHSEIAIDCAQWVSAIVSYLGKPGFTQAYFISSRNRGAATTSTPHTNLGGNIKLARLNTW